jgi:hypothetical protein
MRVGYAARSRDGGKDMGSEVTGGVAAVGGLKSNVRSSLGDDRHKRAGRVSMLCVDAKCRCDDRRRRLRRRKEEVVEMRCPKARSAWVGQRLGQAW